ILALNQLSPNINIQIAPSPVDEPSPGIVLVFNEVGDQEAPIQSSNEVKAGKSCMYQKLNRNKLELSFNTREKAQELRQRSIIDALYFSLIRMRHEPPPANELYQIKESGIEFTPRYASLLQLVYANEFVDGFKLSDFKKLNRK